MRNKIIIQAIIGILIGMLASSIIYAIVPKSWWCITYISIGTILLIILVINILKKK